MDCWICGDAGESGEHLIKASDIRQYFGSISQKNPIYCHTEGKRNNRIGSAKSKKITSGALICKNCNNVVTQPHDRAWEKFFRYYFWNIHSIKKYGKVNLSRIFPGAVGRESVNLQLYFVKLFGCRALEHNAPIDHAKLSEAIITGESCKDIFLTIGITPVELTKKYAGVTPIYSFDNKKKSLASVWIYTVGELSVKIIYSPIVKKGLALGQSWHPDKKSKILKLGII